MNKTEKCIAVRDYHNKGCNCTQSILATFHEEMGLTESQYAVAAFAALSAAV